MTIRYNYQSVSQTTLHVLLILSCISIWLPIGFLSVFMSLFMIVWLISGDYSHKFDLIRQNTAAISAFALLMLYAIGITYSSASLHAAFSFGAKYHKLLFIPMIASSLQSEKMRKLALNVFLATSIYILALSYLKWLGVPIKEFHFNQGNVIFKGRIAHSIFMSFAMYMMLNLSSVSRGYMKLFWLVLSVLAALNILFLVNGRTGQVTMLVLIVWFTWEKWGIKSLKYWTLALLFGIGVHILIPDFPHSRITDIDEEMKQGNISSSGQRIEMYQNTLTLIQEHPIFGGGTGSLEVEYKQLAEKLHSGLIRVPNPHNQYLLTLQELGIIGLAFLFWMWKSHWIASYQLLNKEYGYALRGLIITIMVGSLFNSLILDASEGRFYCILAGILISAHRSNSINKLS